LWGSNDPSLLGIPGLKLPAGYGVPFERKSP
jgi:hypothetical protein